MSRLGRSSLARSVRKHAVLLLAALVFQTILYFPTLFLGRVLSPNDVFYNYQPWRTAGELTSQNPSINDPPTGLYPAASLIGRDGAAFHWNRYLASGVPGYASNLSGVLSPFFLIATIFGAQLFYAAAIFLKLNVALLFTYLWLRQERLGKGAAAVGAIVTAGSGVWSIWWLWQVTSVACLYPAVLYAVARLTAGRRNRTLYLSLLALAIALAGFPAAAAYGVYLAIAYVLARIAATRSINGAELGRAAAATILAVMIAAPSLAAFASFIRNSGYLEARGEVSSAPTYPPSHLASFVDPFRLGDPSARVWKGDRERGVPNSFNESTVYLGLITLPLVALGVFAPRARMRWFWFGLLAVLLLILFSRTGLFDAVANLPGLRFTPLTRLRFLLPLAAGYLAAAGVTLLSRAGRGHMSRFALAAAIGAAVAVDLSLFAARYHPYIRPAVAALPASSTVAFLRTQNGPLRVLPFFDYLWPNSAELVGLEDVRSHFSSESRYRRLLSGVDPGVFGSAGTVLQFNTVRTRLDHPLLAYLNVRYFVEFPQDILRWKIDERATRGRNLVVRRMADGERIVTPLHVDDGVWSAEIICAVPYAKRDGFVDVTVRRPETGAVVWQRRMRANEVSQWNRIYAPLRPHAQSGNVLMIELVTRGMSLTLHGDAPDQFTNPVRLPLLPVALLHDGYVYENLAALPRYSAVWEIRNVEDVESAVMEGNEDLSRVALTAGAEPRLASAIRAVPPAARRVQFRVMRYTGSDAVVSTSSKEPFLLVTSEKQTPELRVYVDGDVTVPLVVNSMFAAVPIGPGSHSVRFERRLGRGYWPLSVLGLAVLIGADLLDRKRRRTDASEARNG